MHFLEFETSDFSGAWCLVFGVCAAGFGVLPTGELCQTIQLGERTFTVVGVMAARVKLFNPSSVQFNRCFKGFIAQNCQMVNDKRNGRPG